MIILEPINNMSNTNNKKFQFNRVKLDSNFISYGTFSEKVKGKRFKFYKPNLSELNERVMIMISGDFGFNNPEILFCSFPLSKKIRKDLQEGKNHREIFTYVSKKEICGRKDDPTSYFLYDTGESFDADDLTNQDDDNLPPLSF